VLENALIEAAWSEVKEHGWSDFSMSRTAERAGASKKSLYARWPDKSSLIAATMRRAAETMPEPIVTSGSLSEDLRAALRALCALLDGPFGTVARGLFLSSSRATRERQQLGDDTRPINAAEEILDHARENGQLGDAEILPRVVNLGFRLVTLHYLTYDEVPDKATIDELVDAIWLPALLTAAPPA
jgi:AcrR family transcriptional regulator